MSLIGQTSWRGLRLSVSALALQTRTTVCTYDNYPYLESIYRSRHHSNIVSSIDYHRVTRYAHVIVVSAALVRTLVARPPCETNLLCSAWFAFLIPCYSTWKALSHRPISDPELERWGMYWVCVGGLVAFENVAQWLVSWYAIAVASIGPPLTCIS
jgi:hypothetical protein